MIISFLVSLYSVPCPQLGYHHPSSRSVNCFARVDVDCNIVFLGVHYDFRENKLVTMLSLLD